MTEVKKKTWWGVFRPVTFAKVIRYCGLGPATIGFVGLFFLCALALWASDPVDYNFWDGIWFSFQVITTIGFGDIYTTGLIAQVITIVLGIVSLFYLALVTGAIVSYCSEITKIKHEGTLANFVHKLENLDQLSQEELTELSTNVKNYTEKQKTFN